MRYFLVVLLLLGAPKSLALEPPYCGDEGVWIQILGSGSLEFGNPRAAPSYLVWIDNRARLMIDAGAGAALRFDESGAAFTDLDALVLSHLHLEHTGDLANLLAASRDADRTGLFPLFGPAGEKGEKATRDYINRLIGSKGAFSELSDLLKFKSSAGYKVSVRDVPAVGRRRWSQFSSENLKLSAVPIHHGGTPSLAWRVDIGEQSVVFAGDLNNQKDTLSAFAANADALIISHVLPDHARGTDRETHVTPSQIGRIAEASNARFLILSSRSKRTFGIESASKAAIEKSFKGSLIFANDLECWGL